MAREWYYAMDGRQLGPFAEEEFLRLFKSNQLLPDTLVWTQEFTNWVPASSVDGLLPRVQLRHPPPIPGTRSGSAIRGGSTKPGWFEVDGRLNRMEYFLRMLILTPAGAIGSGLINAGKSEVVVIGFTILAVVAVFSSFQIIKRFHDMGESGWWQFFLLIPFLNILLGLGLLFGRGTDGPNRFGEKPA